MSKKKIIISIDKDGYVKAEITGVKGSACKDYIKLVEEIVNGKVVDEELTAEYYQQEINEHNEHKLTNGE